MAAATLEVIGAEQVRVVDSIAEDQIENYLRTERDVKVCDGHKRIAHIVCISCGESLVNQALTSYLAPLQKFGVHQIMRPGGSLILQAELPLLHCLERRQKVRFVEEYGSLLKQHDTLENPGSFYTVIVGHSGCSAFAAKYKNTTSHELDGIIKEGVITVAQMLKKRFDTPVVIPLFAHPEGCGMRFIPL